MSELPIKCADECIPCDMCGEPWCLECGLHYADCAHPGPHSEDEAWCKKCDGYLEDCPGHPNE